MPKSQLLIERGRLKEPLAQVVRELMIAPTLSEEEISRSYQHYISINKAHVLMLAETGIISSNVAKKILVASEKMGDMGDTPTFPIVPELEEMYFNLENYLIQEVGIEVGGQQHTARSRNDLHATVDRMETRDALLKLLEKLRIFESTLLDLAKQHKDSVFSGYTHLQPSEPITFAHYLSAILSAISRDSRRLAQSWEDLNKNPLGGGSMGSTTWPINRSRTADLLGFEGVVENSLDAVCSRDYLLEILNSMGLLANTLSRFCMDMRLWCSPEYGYLEVADQVAVCSSIMPQKKNPWTFETVCSFCARVKAHADAAWMTYKGVPYAFTMESMDVIGSFWPAMTALESTLALLTTTVSGLKWHQNRAREWASNNYSTVTELTNTLVRQAHLSFREAHEIVAHAVGHTLDSGKGVSDITAGLLKKISKEVLNKTLSISAEVISQSLNPTNIVKNKSVAGGPAMAEVTRQLSLIEDQLTKQEEWISSRKNGLLNAKQSLEIAVSRFLTQS